MKYAIVILAVAVLAGCGGNGTPETPPAPEPLTTTANVERTIMENDEVVSRLAQSGMDYTVSCVGEDAEGRHFQCLGEISDAVGGRHVAHSFDVTCDGMMCQWQRYSQS